MAVNQYPIPNFRQMAEDALAGLPEQVGEKARAHFLQSFIKEGFTDVSFIAWPKRKGDQTGKILSQSLALRGSIRVAQADLKMIRVVAGEGLPYAAIHNEGGVINVPVTERMKKFFWMMYKKTEDDKWKWMALTKKEQLTIKIPKRQYIGESYKLMQDIDQMFIKKIIEAQKKMKFN
jgi:phage gpG-like protein